MYLAKNIRLIRELSQLTQGEFGKLIGATREQVATFETRGTKPKDLILARIASFASVSAEDLQFKPLLEGDLDLKMELCDNRDNVSPEVVNDPPEEYHSKPFDAPVVTSDFLLSRLAQDHALNYSDSVEIRMIADFAARLVIEGKMDIGDRTAHVDMLLDYATIYLNKKHHTAKNQ